MLSEAPPTSRTKWFRFLFRAGGAIWVVVYIWFLTMNQIVIMGHFAWPPAFVYTHRMLSRCLVDN